MTCCENSLPRRRSLPPARKIRLFMRVPIVLLLFAAGAASFLAGVRLSYSQRREPVQRQWLTHEFVHGPQQERTGPWPEWRLRTTQEGRTAAWTVDPMRPHRATLTTPVAMGEAPFPVAVCRAMKPLVPGDLMLLILRIRSVPSRSGQAMIQAQGPKPVALAQAASLPLDESWQEFQVLWRIGQAASNPECFLQFDAGQGACELADARLVRLNWLQPWLPLPPLPPGGVRVFQRPASVD